MAILVTGGAGFIGNHMTRNLLDNGHDVVTIDNLSTGNDWAVSGNATLVVGDIGDQQLVADVIQNHDVETIIHFAGSIVVQDSVHDPLGYYLNNTVKSHALIKSAIDNGVKHFIFSSTAAVYGSLGMEPAKEDAPLNPGSPYGNSKLMTEIMLREACAVNDMTYGILRYFNVAGADPNGRGGQSSKLSTPLIKVACEVATGKRAEMSIFGNDFDTPDGTCVRDYIHVCDLAEVHRLMLIYLERKKESLTVNCGYGRGFSVREVIEQVGKIAGKDLTVLNGPRREGDPAVIVANAERAKKLLNWEPKYDDLALIVKHALNWEIQLSKRNS